MEWDKKVELIKLGNQSIDSDSRKKFYEYVINNIEDFDNQAFDMLINSVELVKQQLEENTTFCKVVYDKLKNTDTDKFGLRTILRLEMFYSICKDLQIQ